MYRTLLPACLLLAMSSLASAQAPPSSAPRLIQPASAVFPAAPQVPLAASVLSGVHCQNPTCQAACAPAACPCPPAPGGCGNPGCANCNGQCGSGAARGSNAQPCGFLNCERWFDGCGDGSAGFCCGDIHSWANGIYCGWETEPEMWGLTDHFTDDCGNNYLKDNGYKIGGNIDQSFTANPQAPTDHFNGPVTWTDRSNEYQLNQAWLYFERATDTSKGGWDFGGRADVNYGTNARLATETGLEVGHLNSGNAFYGLNFPNLYLDAAYGKSKIRAGHFVSPIGYFTVDMTQNFFSTIPYTYQWGEPFTHTGVMWMHQPSDDLAVSAGVIRGWDNFDNSNPHLGFLGTWSKTFEDKSNLAHVFMFTREPNFFFDFTPRYYQSLVYTAPLTDKLTYVGQTDFGAQQNATYAGKQALWYGLNQYLFYQISNRLTWGINFEWWRDEDGFRVAGFLPSDFPSGITGHQRGFPLDRLGYRGNFYQVTMGPKWYPFNTKNIFVRNSTRVDWFQGNIDPTLNPAQKKPYDSGQENWQVIFVTDMVMLF